MHWTSMNTKIILKIFSWFLFFRYRHFLVISYKNYLMYVILTILFLCFLHLTFPSIYDYTRTLV
ncbi:hypothetical protein C0J52_16569 [Blattella germanica]|nr:hypothetical protein C0J52_16569 [Blattella germanica]